MPFFKAEFVIEAEDIFEAGRLVEAIIEHYNSVWELWRKNVDKMEVREIEEFFDKSIEELT